LEKLQNPWTKWGREKRLNKKKGNRKLKVKLNIHKKIQLQKSESGGTTLNLKVRREEKAVSKGLIVRAKKTENSGGG